MILFTMSSTFKYVYSTLNNMTYSYNFSQKLYTGINHYTEKDGGCKLPANHEPNNKIITIFAWPGKCVQG